ncbi:hypothetical protein KR018_002104 [Drosophila ironensis]|nr:hypothetical protein KR018_002104 [Drosophila ironensis]
MNLNQLAYDLKFFNFSSRDISTEREYLVRHLVAKVVAHACKQLGTPATADLLEAQKPAVVQAILESCQGGLKELTELDQKVFHVPPHVLLFQDIPLSHGYTREDEEKRLEKLKELKGRYRENMALFARLKLEAKKYAEIEEIMKQELEMQKRVNEASEALKLPQLMRLCKEQLKTPPTD